jgi:integrase
MCLPSRRNAQFQQYLDASYSENTKAAYASDVEHFKLWGGKLPSTPSTIARYLAAQANTHAYATLSRRLAAIHNVHIAKGLRSPVRTDLVRATLKGIRRTLRPRQRRVKPLLKTHLAAMQRHMKGLSGQRDRALLLVGFFGAMRRSEIAKLEVRDVEFSKSGMVVHIRHSKTDQEGVGRDVFIPKGKGRLCAVAALQRWMRTSCIGSGALFRRITAYSTVGKNAITAGAVASIVKRHVSRIGLDASAYSGHSLRAGLVTSAAAAGAASWQIRKQTGHKSDAMVARYIREAELYSNNVARLVM